MSQTFLPSSSMSRRTWFWPLAFGLMGALLAVAVYGLLPGLGVESLGGLLSGKMLLVLLVLATGALVYGIYLDLVLERPHWLVGFVLLAWPLVELLNELLLNRLGINLHLRPLMLLVLAVPSVWFILRHLGFVVQAAPHFKYLGIFWVWLLLYFVFNNAHAADPRWMNEAVLSEGSVGLVQMTAYSYLLLMTGVTAVATFSRPDAHQWLDTLNKALLGLSSGVALMTLLGYPFGLFSMELDGFTRATGIFSHPNPYAHHMGVLMLYLLGLFCYYQGPMRDRMPGWLLGGAILLNGAAFLLGLSKTALAVFALCALVLYLLNLSSPIVRRSFIKPALLVVFLLPVLLLVFQWITGQGFGEILTARVEKTQSLDWRVDVWSGLLSQVQGMAFLTGHGFTAANAAVFQMTYSDSANAQPLMMVHNGYLALLYDLGIVGWTYFIAVLSLMGHCIVQMMLPGQQTSRPLLATVLVLCLYFLLVCGFDEMTYMFDAPQVFWVLVTLLFCLVLRDNPLVQLRNANIGKTRAWKEEG